MIAKLSCFEDENVVHVEGSVDPLRDIETINLELILADMDVLDRRLQKTKKSGKSGDKALIAEAAFLERLMEHLESGECARSFEIEREDEKEIFDSINLLTAKPVLYAANVSEDDAATGNAFVEQVKEFAAKEGSEVFTVCAQIEQEIAELDDDEKQMFLEELGIGESGLDKLIAASYKLLGLISYLTAGEKETKAWTITKGTKAPQAAGKIHSDFERGFIRAEIVSYDDLMACGTYTAAKEKGLVRLEGKDYVMQDGDIVVFRFNV